MPSASILRTQRAWPADTAYKALGAKPPAGFALPYTLFYLAWTVFSLVNTVYFVKRREIFFTDIVRLVTGRVKGRKQALKL
jgi:hypothetical protein